MSMPVVAEVVRSGFVEGHHRGAVVALGVDGEVDWAVGDVRAPMLPRSCNKPVQAVAMVRLGLELPPELLALACASHSGEEFHVDGVRRILALAGLDETALQTPPDWPLEEAVKEEVLRSGGERTRMRMNCSGKHAAMLVTCVVNGWATDDYLEPGHPLQAAIRDVVAELTAEPVAADATDGCGAPLLGTTLVGLATAFARLARGESGPERAVAEAIRRHPAWVSGSRRDERALLVALPGAIGKMGAEASQVLALPDGRAVALKVDDGADRARPVVMAAALERAGFLAAPGADGDAVRLTGRAPLLGGGREVGEIRAAL